MANWTFQSRVGETADEMREIAANAGLTDEFEALMLNGTSSDFVDFSKRFPEKTGPFLNEALRRHILTEMVINNPGKER